MTGGAVVHDNDGAVEKVGMRNAWGNIAVTYDQMFAARMAHLTGRGLDLLAPEPHWDGLDVACGPGVTTAALAERLPGGRALGVDFREPLIARAQEHFSNPNISFAVDHAERLSQPTAAFGAVTCNFGLMYCCDAPSALQHMARVVAPGGRLMMLVWGRAERVWWSPMVELLETRAQYYASLFPMVFSYGLPGVLGRMVSEAKLAVTYDETIDERMAFPSVDEAVRMAFLAGPLAGLYTKSVDDQQARDTRHLVREHLSGLAEASGREVFLPAEIRIVVAEKPR